MRRGGVMIKISIGSCASCLNGSESFEFLLIVQKIAESCTIEAATYYG